MQTDVGTWTRPRPRYDPRARDFSAKGIDVTEKHARRSGRTLWMIDQLVSAVAEGQPRSVVVAHSLDHAQQLRRRVATALQAAGLAVDDVRDRILFVEGSTIEFTTPDTLKRACSGDHGAGIFWDHHALERLKEVP